jgi:hypothetical protein
MQAGIRVLLIGGIVLIVIAGLLYLFGKLNFPIGHLPGDIYIQGKQGRFYFPLTTCILISIILTILLNLLPKIIRK